MNPCCKFMIKETEGNTSTMGIKQKLANLKKNYRKLSGKIERGLVGKKQYVYYLEHCPVKEKTVLLESQLGGSLGGNIFAILKELCENPDYAGYQLYLSCKKEQMESRRAFLAGYGLAERTKLLSVSSKEYFKVLATAKYLINDNTFVHVFIKRPEQIYFNTWHGTPFKTLGRKIKKDYAGIGNAQHTMFTADYLLYPNEFTMEHMLEDYMIPSWGSAKILLSGYPRTSVFLTKGRRDEIRKECGIEHMEVYAYLPTWRGIVGKVTSKQQNERLYRYLEELDTKLADNQRVYVKLHPVSVKDMDLSALKKVVPFPAEKYDTYEFLNATDGLITDYSSIFFDYAVTRKKIILFAYDKEEYIADRGFYFSMDELPFPQTATVDELLACMNAPKSYDDEAFIQKFCKYEHADVTNALLRRVFFGEASSLIEERELQDNKKKNVVFYLGAIKDNKITRAAMEFFQTADFEKHNYMVIFKIEDLKKNQERLLPLPEAVTHFGHYDNISLSLWDMFLYKLWRDKKLLPYGLVKRIIEKKAKFESQRIFGGCRVDEVVQFTGYSVDMIAALQAMPCRRIIFAHNDMEKATKGKNGMDRKLLADAYRTYDVVAVTEEEHLAAVKNIAGEKVNIAMVQSVAEYQGLL